MTDEAIFPSGAPRTGTPAAPAPDTVRLDAGRRRDPSPRRRVRRRRDLLASGAFTGAAAFGFGFGGFPNVISADGREGGSEPALPRFDD